MEPPLEAEVDPQAPGPDDDQPNDRFFDPDTHCKKHISELDLTISFPSPGDYDGPASPQFRHDFDRTFNLVMQLYDRLGPQVSVLFAGVSCSDLTAAQLRTLMLRQDFYWSFVKDATLGSSSAQLTQAASVMKTRTIQLSLALFAMAFIITGLCYIFYCQSHTIGDQGRDLASARRNISDMQSEVTNMRSSLLGKERKLDEDAREFRSELPEFNESQQARRRPNGRGFTFTGPGMNQSGESTAGARKGNQSFAQSPPGQIQKSKSHHKKKCTFRFIYCFQRKTETVTLPE
jgi:hypothetical protein